VVLFRNVATLFWRSGHPAVLTAVLFSSILSSGPSFGQARGAGPATVNPNTGDRAWPAVSNWQVFSGHLPDGRRICTAQHNVVQMTGYGYTVGFSFSERESRFALLHIGPGAPAATEIAIQADGRPVASFAAVSSAGYGPGNALHPINAIMPGDSYLRVVSLALSRAREMTVIAGKLSYRFELGDFGQMSREMTQCALLGIWGRTQP
jgi:hypothetical protein